MKNIFRTLGASLFLSACLLFGLSFFKIIAVSETANEVAQVSSSSPKTQQSSTQKTDQTKQSTNKQTTKQTTKATQQGTSTKIKFTVSSDDTSYSVADKLLEKGIIKSVESFNDYMLNNDLAQYIQTGTFELRKDMSLEELGQTLTTYPGN